MKYQISQKYKWYFVYPLRVSCVLFECALKRCVEHFFDLLTISETFNLPKGWCVELKSTSMHFFAAVSFKGNLIKFGSGFYCSGGSGCDEKILQDDNKKGRTQRVPGYDSGINFTNILRSAFMRSDPKCTK